MATTRKLVVAVDETESSQVAFLWVLHNLARHSDHIVIFNAAPYVGSQFSDADIANEYLLPSLASEQVAEAAEKEVTERSMSIVNRCLAKCQELGFSCEGEVVKGEPGSWIIDESERLDADVVVVGCREAGLITRTLFGSVGENVLHNALCPVVIVRPAEKLQDSLVTERSRNIVIAVDDSKEAAGAFVWALQNFCRVTDKVTIYHVHKSSVPSITSSVTGEFGIEDVYLTPDTTDEMEVKALTDSEKLVEKFMSYVSDESKVHTKIRNRLSTMQFQRLVYCRENLKVARAFKEMTKPKQVDIEIVTRSRSRATTGRDSSSTTRLAPRGPRPRQARVIRGSSSCGRGLSTESGTLLDAELDLEDDEPSMPSELMALEFDDEGRVLDGIDVDSSSSEDSDI